MEDWLLDYRPHVPKGGRASSGPAGSIHVSFRSGSRGSGASAAAAFAYITRTDQYEDRDLDEALHVESGHMPAWAEKEPEHYWDAADLFERANGRLYVSGDFALPRGLELEDQVAMVREFVEDLTEAERLPYTFAIQAGRGDNGLEHNPHAHVLISERKNDGVERQREQWFRRANRDHPERGGAPKSRTFHGPRWVEHARERWAELINRTMQARGRSDRVDHRSFARQGIDRESGQHFGPAAAHLLQKGREHDRLEDVVRTDEAKRRIGDINREIGDLERERVHLMERASRETSSGGTGGSRGGGRGRRPRAQEREEPNRDDDLMPGR
jgi:hypothetical protein